MRIACVLAADFEDSELRVPYDAFTDAGYQVIVIGMDKGATLNGKRGQERVKTDLAIRHARPDDFVALFIPGGGSPDHLRAHPEMLAFVRGFADKPILAICHGPQLLISADLVRGRRMTAWRTVQVDLRNAGAEVVDQAAVVDGKLVTSREPGDLAAFVRAALGLLGYARAVEHAPGP